MLRWQKGEEAGEEEEDNEKNNKKCTMKWQLILIALLMFPLAHALKDCEGPTINKGDLPCLIISSWSFDCSKESVNIFNEVPILIRNSSLADYGVTSKCNLTFGKNTNETEIGSYLFNWTTGDSSKLIIEEDNNMLIALVIGVTFIVGLFIFLTFAVKEDKPFLANFFFLGIFIFTTVLSNLLWKITSINSAPYEPIMLIVYRLFLIITMLMIFIVLLLLTIGAVQLRRWKGNPVDNYRDNLNEKNNF